MSKEQAWAGAPTQELFFGTNMPCRNLTLRQQKVTMTRTFRSLGVAYIFLGGSLYLDFDDTSHEFRRSLEVFFFFFFFFFFFENPRLDTSRSYDACGPDHHSQDWSEPKDGVVWKLASRYGGFRKEGYPPNHPF